MLAGVELFAVLLVPVSELRAGELKALNELLVVERKQFRQTTRAIAGLVSWMRLGAHNAFNGDIARGIFLSDRVAEQNDVH